MLSLKNVVAVKLAVEICNHPLLKKEILRVPGSDFDANKSRYVINSEKQWVLLLETKAKIFLETLGITRMLQEKVLVVVLSVENRILSWAEYHERILGFSRNYSFSVINSSLFSTRGIVDCKKAAEELIKSKSLTVKQKYKLALLYCMNNHILDLYKEMTEKDMEEFYNSVNPRRINQPPFVKFWSYYLKDEVDKLIGDTDPNLYWLEMAVESGSRDVVEYCLEKTNFIKNENALIYAALESIRNKIKGGNRDFLDNYWRKYYQVPNHYYIDVLCFLFSKMRQDTQIRFLKLDIEGSAYRDIVLEQLERSRVLEFFLDWPYQDFFLTTARLMWDFLPELSYFKLIALFSCRIGKRKCRYRWYREEKLRRDVYSKEKHYDYRELLRDFLNIFKRFSVTKKITRSLEVGRYIILPMFDHDDIPNAGTNLISRLLTLENFTYQDKMIIESILNNATNDEKEKIISSTEGIYTCSELMRMKRWKLLDEFVSSCYASREDVCKFKRELSKRESVNDVCVEFIKKDDWHAFETFIKWSILSDAGESQLKEKVILSEYGRKECLKIISSNRNLVPVNKIITEVFSY